MNRKRKIMAYAVLFLVVFVLSAVLTAGYYGALPQKLLEVEWNDTVGRTYTNLDYQNENGHQLDLYIPNSLEPEKTQYLILFIHGGSFNSGSKEDMASFCKYYADKGYITATLDYTLQTKGLDASLSIMNSEIKNAVDAIYAKCRELGFDLGGMATSGVSAGGTLAMNYALMSPSQSAIPVKFVFQLAAPADFEPSEWDLLKKVDKLETDAEFATMMTGYPITDAMMESGEYSKYIDEISPARMITDDTVPFLIGYGLKDHCVPAQLKFLLMDALDSHGVTYDYIAFPNSNHGLYSDLDKLQEFLDKSLEYCEEYFD
ncbi:alpha/beta hydrolase [Paenibacillus dakarensis]|uniref:alpha/beta hydrolase n=1 Tax=Paenibacillus dakarensis TaxID=1527293 RepID=UPI000A8A408B|nr:alpha/beta hydrolase [Paenibacillus dakarensis]